MPRPLPLLLVVLLALAGCAHAAEVRTSAGPNNSVSTSPSATAGSIGRSAIARPALVAPEAAARLLAAAPRGPRHPVLAPYARDEFGTPWLDLDDNGCNQRDDVLLRDALPGTALVAPQGRCDHDVLAGTWIDPYTGRRMVMTDLKDLRQAQAVQIDHIVPLAEAWRSGAAAWSQHRRWEFANDLDVLVAADGPTNAGKSDDDPAAWRPKQAHQCDYAIRWLMVKAQWGLTVDRSERRALREMLATCP